MYGIGATACGCCSGESDIAPFMAGEDSCLRETGIRRTDFRILNKLKDFGNMEAIALDLILVLSQDGVRMEDEHQA
jgi:hypothetical protein